MIDKMYDCSDVYIWEESKSVLYSLAFLTLVFVGRIHEIYPVLSQLSLVKVGFIVSLICVLRTSSSRNSLGSVLAGVPGRYLIMMFIFSFFSVWGGVWPSASFTFLKELSYRMLYFILVAASLTSIRGIRFFLKSTVLMYAILVVSALLVPSLVNNRLRVTVTYDPNDFALFLVMCLPMLFFFLFADRSRGKKIMFLVLFVIGSWVIIATGSRGGVLALFAGVLFVVRRYKSVKVILLSALVAVLSVWFLLTVNVGQMTRLETIFTLGSDYNLESSHGRVALWKRGFVLLQNNPILGVGVGAYKYAEGQVNEGGKWLTAHNSYLQCGVETGIPALIVFMVMLFKSYFLLNRIRASNCEIASIANGLQGALLVYSVGSIFLSWAYAYPLYFVLSIVSATASIYQKESLGHIEHT